MFVDNQAINRYFYCMKAAKPARIILFKQRKVVLSKPQTESN